MKIGVDICSLERISKAYARFGERFLTRILTVHEKEYVLRSPRHTISRLAGRFSAKEAASKALGTGWYGIGFKDIEIQHLASGAPSLKLHGRAAKLAEQKGLKNWEVSISHEREFAFTSVLAY